MVAAPIPADDHLRLIELYKYELLDTPYEQEFDEIVNLASRICNVPMSLITLVDSNRQWFKAKYGLSGEQTDRSVSFCGHAIASDNLFEVRDAQEDERFYDNPYVLGEPFVRYYAGIPLVTGSGHKLGTLCVIDTIPRNIDSEQVKALQTLSNQVMKLFELRLKNKELKKITEVHQKLLTILAHDVRGPLSAIQSSYELKKLDYLTEEDILEFDRMIPLQVSRTLLLLNSTVEWGKLLITNHKEASEFVNLFQVCNSCFDLMAVHARTKNNMLVNKVPPALEMNMVKEGLDFVLRNLLNNANKFTENGTITVEADLSDNQLCIMVADTGIGMSDELQLSINERSWLPINEGTHNEKGSGVGLKLINEYLQSINGAIRFESELGKGTKVIISFKMV